MRLNHEDKSITAHEAKLSPAAQAAFDRLTAELTLTADEQHAVGLAVAIAAENASRRPYQVEITRLAEPTQAEASELAAAIAEHQALVKVSTAKRALAIAAEREVRSLFEANYQGYAGSGDDRRLAQAQAEVRAAASELDIAVDAQRPAEARLGRLRGAMNSSAVARQRAYVGGRI